MNKTIRLMNQHYSNQLMADTLPLNEEDIRAIHKGRYLDELIKEISDRTCLKRNLVAEVVGKYCQQGSLEKMRELSRKHKEKADRISPDDMLHRWKLLFGISDAGKSPHTWKEEVETLSEGSGYASITTNSVYNLTHEIVPRIGYELRLEDMIYIDVLLLSGDDFTDGNIHRTMMLIGAARARPEGSPKILYYVSEDYPIPLEDRFVEYLDGVYRDTDLKGMFDKHYTSYI